MKRKRQFALILIWTKGTPYLFTQKTSQEKIVTSLTSDGADPVMNNALHFISAKEER